MRWVPARYKDEVFLHEVEHARHRTGEVHVWWLGQSGFLLQWNHIHVLIDPYLSDSLTKKYEGSGKPHIRMCERVIAPEKLSFIDIVTSSHNHTDHLDAETLIPFIILTPVLPLLFPKQTVNSLHKEFINR